MNTEDSTHDQSQAINAVLSSEDDEKSPLAIKVENLEKRLETEKDHRLEDRFIFLIIIILLIDIILLNGATNISLTLGIMAFQLIFLLLLAKRMGVQQLAAILDRILNTIARSNG